MATGLQPDFVTALHLLLLPARLGPTQSQMHMQRFQGCICEARLLRTTCTTQN